MRSTPSLLQFLLPGYVSLLFFAPILLSAQEQLTLKHWKFEAGYVHYDLSKPNGWGSGLRLSAEYRPASRIGIALSPSLMFSSDGFYTFLGVAGDLQGTWRWEFSHFDLSPRLGFSALHGGDSDGSILSGFGLVVGGEGTLWLNGWFGLYGGYDLRAWLVGPVEGTLGRYRQSVTGGFGIRF